MRKLFKNNLSYIIKERFSNLYPALMVGSFDISFLLAVYIEYFLLVKCIVVLYL